MARIFSDNAQSIGNTPLVKLNRIVKSKGTILAKIEGRNPSYSVKCRVGVGMIRDAMDRGELTPGKEIIEATSGNTGIALAFTAASLNIPLTLAMPETMSAERRKVLQMFGAKLILTPGSEGMLGAVRTVERLAEENPDRYFMPQQFKNPSNPAIHEKTTGPEIWNDTDGNVDVVVAGVGTGGTITGISRYIKRTQQKNIISIAVEPKESPVITQHLSDEAMVPGPHPIQGIGAGFIPETLELSMIDRVETVAGSVAVEYARRLAKEEGILSGISSGAAVAAVDQLCKSPEFRDKTIVVILPDAGERYLSTTLFEGLE